MSTEETLNRHRDSLQACAQRYGLTVYDEDVYQEVVSGESLFARPQMLRLLEAVTEARYDLVLCMDMQRLGRGGMYDQGAILDAFKVSETLIVTPERIYDLADEIDEESAEMETFISRREYKLINKRLRRGLNQSIAAGAYTANPPFGYRKTIVGKLPSLEIIPEEAEVVRLIFELYTAGNGCTKIEREINAMGVHGRRGSRFNRNTIRLILGNPVYIGKIRWNRTVHVKSGVGAARETKIVYQPRDSWKLFDGRHQAIIDPPLWEAVQQIINSKYRRVHNHTPANPLAGLVHCSKCGRNMNMMQLHKGVAYLLCPTPSCCAGAKFEFVESSVLSQLQAIMDTLAVQLSERKPANTNRIDGMLAKASTQLQKLVEKKERLYGFLEDGTYTQELFKERMEKLTGEEHGIQQLLEQLQSERSSTLALDKAKQLEQLRTVLTLYDKSSIVGKRHLLHNIVADIQYTKEKKTKQADFTLDITLRTGD